MSIIDNSFTKEVVLGKKKKLFYIIYNNHILHVKKSIVKVLSSLG